MISSRLQPFGTTIFAEMTALALRHQAVNLSQGFPDFDGPSFIVEAAAAAMKEGKNQYARSFGVPALNEAISAWYRGTGIGEPPARTGLTFDPDTEITVTSGCTEAIAAAMLGLFNPGDEVVVFEPFYDSYRACMAMAGVTPRFVALRPAPSDCSSPKAEGLSPSVLAPPATDTSGFFFDEAELRAAFTPRTRGVLLNTPHNPTGKIFTRAELELVAKLCVEHNAIGIVDEVYERLTYLDALPHIRMASLPDMRERTLILSSLGKTFSLTGWKIGWAAGRHELTAGLRSAHQFLTFSTATPLQYGAAAALALNGPGEQAITDLLTHYHWARDYLTGELAALGFRVHPCQGTYFLMAEWEGSRIAHTMQATGAAGVRTDADFCKRLTAEAGVAAIPPSVFYDRPELGRSMVRLAFCKRRQTLEEAVRRLRAYADRA